MAMRLEDCLRQFIRDDYGGVPKFAKEIGVPPTTIYNVLSRGVSGSGFDTVRKIYDALGLNYRIIGLDDDHNYEEMRLKRNEERRQDRQGFVDIPVYGHIAAGIPIEMDESDYDFPCPSYLTLRHPKAFFLEVEGESMNRVLPNGCLALVDPTLRDHVVSGNAYAVCVNGHDATIKRVRVLENGVELDPDSTDPTFHPTVYDNTIPDTETITIIGEVVWYTVPFDFEI